MTEEELEENQVTITQSVVAYAATFSDDPETLALLLADACTLVLGVAELDLGPVLNRMQRTYVTALKASAEMDGASTNLN